MTSHDGTQDAFARGVEQFNRREFFESHESWETIWLGAVEPEKTFLQGITQVAAAFHHLSRENRDGAESLLRRGLEKLERFPAQFRGIELGELRATAKRWLSALQAGASPEPDRLPRIEWIEARDS